MRRVLYFEPSNGASGDMIVGALIDMGLPLDLLSQELDKLGISEEFSLKTQSIERQGLRMTNFQVVLASNSPGSVQEDPAVTTEKRSHHHDHDHGGQVQRGLTDITNLIKNSALSKNIQQRALKIFKRLGESEAKVHGTSIDKVHFHEVGAVDSIIDIVGACIGFDYLKIEEFYSAPIAIGGGTVTFSHGCWPVPTPATLEMLPGVPCHPGPVQSELLTPTGAAIITTISNSYVCPDFSPKKWGLGAGDKTFHEIPNALRITLGERHQDKNSSPNMKEVEQEKIIVLEGSLDNTDGEVLGNLIELSLRNGALDVYYSTLNMKKSRPGVLLTVLCRHPQEANLVRLVFRETGILGLRRREMSRYLLSREIITVETKYGAVRVKVGKLSGEIVHTWPEFEDLKSLSRENGVALKTLRAEVVRKLGENE